MPSFRAVVWMRVAVACACLLGAAAGSPAAGQDIGGPADAALQAFDAGIARYVALRAKFETPLPALGDPRLDGWRLFLMRRYLASAIRAARSEAEQGCIFGPAAGVIRETIARTLYEVDIEGPVDFWTGEDEFVLDLALNEPIPAWALSPVPPPLLERLPPLASAIEYRIAGAALVLWDSDAEILIDALPDAFVAP
jgi:hypothetical protein